MLLAVATAVSLVFLIFPEELVLLTSGAEFEPGADALRLLAPYPMLFFVNALLWRVMIAAGHDRALLAIAASVLTLNVVLNVALLPAYGFRAASVNVVVTEVFSIALSAFVLRRREGFLPSLRYGVAIAAAAVVMSAVALLLPVHWVIAATAAIVAYAGVLLVLPGSIRDGVRQIRHELRSDP